MSRKPKSESRGPIDATPIDNVDDHEVTVRHSAAVAAEPDTAAEDAVDRTSALEAASIDVAPVDTAPGESAPIDNPPLEGAASTAPQGVKHHAAAPRSKQRAHAAASAERAPSKLDRLIAVLQRNGGADMTSMTDVTGWQAHSIRGAMSGALKHKGHTITSSRDGERRIWRIAAPAASDA